MPRRPRRSQLLLAAALVLLGVAVVPRPGGGGPALRASWTLTPGVLNPDVTQASVGETICRRGWTRTIRPSSSYTGEL